MLRHDPRLIEALAKRGITDIEKVLIDVWGYRGFLLPDRWPGRRLGWTDIWFRSEPGSNPYANPVNGLHCVVDLNAMELLEIEDTFEVDRPQIMGEYVPRFVPDMRLRDDLRPVEITQPDGRLVHAGRARAGVAELDAAARASTTARGSSCTTLGFDGRPIAHRISLAEMVVPYRDPSPDHYRRTAYDIGEWGLGFMTAVAGAGLRLPGRDHATSTPCCTTRPASRTRSRTPSASTRRTTASCGSTSTTRRAPRSGARGGSSSPST